MTPSNSRKTFRLVLIDAFDARRGYKRCPLPGVGVSWVGGVPRGANADFWRSRTGEFVVRFSSQGYVYHFEAFAASGKQIPENEIPEFGDFIADALCEWVDEGVDDVPSALYETPHRSS